MAAMKRILCVTIFGLFSFAHALAESKGHPIAKVVTMLEGLKVQAREEMQQEALSYQKYVSWCANTKKELSTQIEKEKSELEVLEETIASKTKLTETITVEIAALEKELEKGQAGGAEADKIREETNKAYQDADKDFKSTIDAIDECIASLQDSKKEALLVKTTSFRRVLTLADTLLSDTDRDQLNAFVQMAKAPEAPAAKVYDFKSGNVIELLKKLKDKFEDDQLEATKAETNSLNAYNLAKDARDHAEKAARKSKTEKETIKSEAESDLAEMTATQKETSADLEDNQNNLDETESGCSLKADEWQTRTKTRNQEIEAMDTAIKILAKVGGVRAPNADGGGDTAASFLQIDDPKAKAVKMLVAEAEKLHSKSLKRFAQDLGAHLSGPFDEVNQMIQKMIFRLMAEQTDEDSHKNWCDMEVEKSTESRDDKQAKKEELDNKIGEAEAKTVDIANDISELQREVGELEVHIAEATEIRTADHDENLASIKDAQDAQAAIASATAVLTQFYKDSGKVPKEPWEFLQVHAPVAVEAPPSTWESSYTGLSSEPDGILTMLNKISEDFATMEAETKANEAMDQKAYDADMTTSQVSKAEKEKSIEMKTHERARLVDKLKGWTKQNAHLKSELESVLQYLKDLEPACIKGDSSYEARKAARTEEIEALRKAQTVLEEAFKAKEFLQRNVPAKRH